MAIQAKSKAYNIYKWDINNVQCMYSVRNKIKHLIKAEHEIFIGGYNIEQGKVKLIRSKQQENNKSHWFQLKKANESCPRIWEKHMFTSGTTGNWTRLWALWYSVLLSIYMWILFLKQQKSLPNDLLAQKILNSQNSRYLLSSER